MEVQRANLMHSRLLEEANAIANLESAMKAILPSAAAITAALKRLKCCLVNDNDSSRHADVIRAADEKFHLILDFDKHVHSLNAAISAKRMAMLDSEIEAATTYVAGENRGMRLGRQ